MQTINDTHLQFAGFFRSNILKPFAYLVSKNLGEGHICLDLEHVLPKVNALPFLRDSEPLTAMPELLKEKHVATKDEPRQPFIWHNNKLYLQRYFHYESLIIERIQGFISSEQECEEERSRPLESVKPLVKELFKGSGVQSVQQTNWQLVAALTGVLNNFTIITGGPGTGKTTTVAKILAILFSLQPDLKVALVAPTGKAASRMAESLNNAKLPLDEEIRERFQQLEPATIHRLLKFIPDSPYFRHNKDNPLNYDVVIADESSMLDVALFAKLLDAIGPNTRLLMLGDRNQLASVEAGSLFGDLCCAMDTLNLFSGSRRSFINGFIEDANQQIGQEHEQPGGHPLFEHIVELRFSHRFSDEDGIGKFSKAVISNNIEAVESFIAPGADEQVIIDTAHSDAVFHAFIEGYKDFVQEADILTAIVKLNRLRVLCAIREGEQGLYAVNRKIEDYLHRKRILNYTGEFYEHRPVIVTQNNYTLGLFNGDIGIIRKDANGVVRAWFEDGAGGVKSVLPGYITQMETMFAMTIHKSQGSEFDHVLVLLPRATDISILTRELLYTAVTRARKKVIIQGSSEVILNACEASVQRCSGIIDRLNEPVTLKKEETI